ncbi:Detected protein of unknown function [Hibiscus syriacus]|uniref:LisH domain-containing protein n=1 Tax=Hibiscus syriacus TaxID=106335 RepID=A0A6A3BK05_HIBSY|nr:WD repeat-containing protein 91-like [Hibiscus syriacus]KAE8716231.1 Detected protein of unknown function [Hibiscus syriacus]
MDTMQQAEELVREYLVFRGFTNTLKSFETELCTDIGNGFQVNKMLDLIFAVYIPKFQAEKLVGLFRFFEQWFSSWSETAMLETLSELECSVLRCYIVHALQTSSRFSDSKRSKYCRDEMSSDADGRQLLVTSGSVRAPIFQVQGHSSGFRTLSHTAAITTVDWHPTLPIFLTGQQTTRFE